MNNSKSALKKWVMKAIKEEDLKPSHQLWKKEPSVESRVDQRKSLVKFLRKHSESNNLGIAVAQQLEQCERFKRCCSGACPECGRLVQRWFVRASKSFICDVIDKDDQELVAITIIPTYPIISPGQLSSFSITDFQRRLKFALDKIELETAIGGIDFSLNEDRDGRYEPFWCPHFYLITSVSNAKRLKRRLKDIFERDKRVPRPVKISNIDNLAWCRSYAFKIMFERRIGYYKIKWKDGIPSKRRNTSHDKLRAAERVELFIYLDQCGFANRVIFWGAKPIVQSTKVRIRKA